MNRKESPNLVGNSMIGKAVRNMKTRKAFGPSGITNV